MEPGTLGMGQRGQFVLSVAGAGDSCQLLAKN